LVLRPKQLGLLLLSFQKRNAALSQCSDTVFSAFAIADEDGEVFQVNIFDA